MSRNWIRGGSIAGGNNFRHPQITQRQRKRRQQAVGSRETVLSDSTRPICSQEGGLAPAISSRFSFSLHESQLRIFEFSKFQISDPGKRG